MLALPIFTASHPATIVGELELNFCVRDGNRWTLKPINTNYISVTGFPESSIIIIANIFQMSREILVTRTGFEPMLTA